MPIPASITLDQQIEAVAREIGMRARVYPRWVASNKMSQAKADHEQAAMRAVLATLQECKRRASLPDPLGEALNSGDGVYRP
jgi:hypothetical protein